MRLTMDRNALLKALGHVSGIVERRNTIPILANILIRATGDHVTLTATDLEIEAVETLPAKVEQSGEATVPAHTLHEIVRKLPDGAEIKAQIDADNARMKIVAGRSTFELAILPASDFPNMGEAALPHKFTIPAFELKRLFEKPRFAISTDETRYYLNGIYLHGLDGGKEQKLRAVATDGHRLAQVETALSAPVAGLPGVIVPRKAVAETIKLLEGDTPVTVSLSQSKIRFQVGDIVLTSKLIDGSFPDYARVIPTANKKVMKVENSDLMRAVDRVSTLSSEKSRAIKLNLASDRLTVSANNPDAGSAEEELFADYSGDPLEVGFNARYLLDIAGQIDGSHAEFRLADGSSPTLVLDEGDESALYVLMPMRV